MGNRSSRRIIEKKNVSEKIPQIIPSDEVLIISQRGQINKNETSLCLSSEKDSLDKKLQNMNTQIDRINLCVFNNQLTNDDILNMINGRFWVSFSVFFSVCLVINACYSS